MAEVEFRQIESDADVLAVARTSSLAYPTGEFYSDATLPKLVKILVDRRKNSDKRLYGLFLKNVAHFEPGQVGAVVIGAKPNPITSEIEHSEVQPSVEPSGGLVAHFLHRDFSVNLFGVERTLGGLAFVGVDLLHKKRGYAKTLVTQWLKLCDNQGQYLAALWPFRPDFYTKMGFGVSSPFYDYTITPSVIPTTRRFAGNLKHKGAASFDVLRHLTVAQISEITECQKRCASATHGMLAVEEQNVSLFNDNGITRVLGFRDSEKVLRGYIAFKFVKVDHVGSDLNVVELIYETTEALYAILQFLRQQDDQVRFIKIKSQDTDFFRLLEDPRGANSSQQHVASSQSVGMMYKVVNIVKLFSEYFIDRDFNGVDLTVLIRVQDTLTPEMNPEIVVSFVKGHATVVKSGSETTVNANETTEATLDIGIAEFSTLVVGAIDLKTLIKYGKAIVVPADKERVVTKAFWSEDLPKNSFHF
ncbi:hypothetical protein HK100_012786 [Physocladia obscura]|uniref:Eis-like acetyltransferase domain-containing protein n=1 Tax=Physocladia obscura TaxID=109957 RepID=A0AAD5SZA3_9FUNG|nr:hypothetical protein HK100_012786 [Physocladia obscura]